MKFFCVALSFLSSLALADLGPVPQTLAVNAIRIENGSGFAVKAPSGKRYLMTCWHVCNSSTWKGEVHYFDQNGQHFQGRIVKQDPRHDLCAIQFSGYPPGIPVSKGVLLPIKVCTRGWPEMRGPVDSCGVTLNYKTWEAEFPIGEVGACPGGFQPRDGFSGHTVSCTVNYRSLLSNLYARPGVSGSAVVGEDTGELVGVLSSFHPGDVYEGGMVPLSDIIGFLKGL